jgi:hypothetical protein
MLQTRKAVDDYQAERARAKPSANAIPEWLTNTPDECCYEIIMFDNDGGSLQAVGMSRDEFDYLKRCLAIRRGLVNWVASEDEEVLDDLRKDLATAEAQISKFLSEGCALKAQVSQ